MAKLIGRAGNFNIKIKRIYQNATIDVKKKGVCKRVTVNISLHNSVIYHKDWYVFVQLV